VHWWGSGFIPILIYAGFAEFVEQGTTILTENNFDLLAEDGSPLLIE
jgi:hypothetical protein